MRLVVGLVDAEGVENAALVVWSAFADCKNFSFMGRLSVLVLVYVYDDIEIQQEIGQYVEILCPNLWVFLVLHSGSSCSASPLDCFSVDNPDESLNESLSSFKVIIEDV